MSRRSPSSLTSQQRLLSQGSLEPTNESPSPEFQLTLPAYVYRGLQKKAPEWVWACQSKRVFSSAWRRWFKTFLHDEQTGLSHWVWQVGLSTVLLYDWIQYELDPDGRFGNTRSNLWLGWAPNPGALGTHWGSDRAQEWVFWAAPMTLSLLAAIHALRACCPRALRLPLDDMEASLPIEAYTKHRELMDNFTYLSHPTCSESDQIHLLKQLIATGHRGRWDLRYRAITQVICFLKQQWHQADEQANARMLAMPQTECVQMASEAVQAYLTLPNGLSRIFARYTLGNQGLAPVEVSCSYHKTLAWSVVWLLSQLARQFVRYHYWRLFMMKSWEAIEMFRQQHACEASHRQFFYEQRLDETVCAICPDWPFVDWVDIDDPQECLSALLRQQSFSPSDLVAKLSRLKFHTPVTSIDLSHQAWADDEALSRDWLQVFDALQELVVVTNSVPLQRLDVSNALRHPAPIEWIRLRRLGDFIEATKPLEVRLRHFHLGVSAWKMLMPKFAAQQVLDFSHSDWGDGGFRALFNHSLPFFHILYAEHSQLTDASLQVLNARWLDLTLSDLSLGRNAFTTEGVLAWSERLAQRPADRLDLSGLFLSPDLTHKLWPVLTRMKQLVLRDCDLNDRALLGLGDAFPGAQLIALDVSSNPFTDEAMRRLAVGLARARLQRLNVSYTGLSPVGLTQLGNVLPQIHNLVTLDVSGCLLGSGTDEFFTGLLHSSVRDLHLNAVRLNALGLQRFAWHWQRAVNVSLQAIALADNRFSSTELSHWLLGVQNRTCCQRLDLAHNGLNDSILAPLSKVPLSQLYLTDNAISDLSLLGWDPGRVALFVDRNLLQDERVLSWIREGLTPMSYFDQLGTPSLRLSRAQRRDMAKQRFLGELQTLDISQVALDARTVTTLCRVSQVTGVDLSMGDVVCQRSDATMVGAPGLRLLRHLRQVTLQAVGAWAGHVVKDARPRGGAVGFFAAPVSASPTRFDGVSWLIGCVCLLSVWWWVRHCRRSVSSTTHRPERLRTASSSASVRMSSSVHAIKATPESESASLAEANSSHKVVRF